MYSTWKSASIMQDSPHTHTKIRSWSINSTFHTQLNFMRINGLIISKIMIDICSYMNVCELENSRFFCDLYTSEWFFHIFGFHCNDDNNFILAKHLTLRLFWAWLLVIRTTLYEEKYISKLPTQNQVKRATQLNC